ncbi:phosphotransferase [uncultured Roseovarius sp.]|uniref:phosphotransferase family protein n=1 Tax=uncultured Roseovarius sp. TaxID=293344 RepID=UPI0026095D71|nr:phosphotransferase [uncultured Roseovarius sp.]
MSDTDKIPRFPDLSAMMQVTQQLETARAMDPMLKEAQVGELLRLVAGKRAVVEGRFQGRPAVFRLCLDPSSDMIAREWDEMQRLWPLMQSSRYRVAEPLHLSSENHLMVVEHASGTPLMEHLNTCAPSDRLAIWPPIAAWLRHAIESTETWRTEGHSGWLTRAERAATSQPFPELRSVEAAILLEIKRIGALFEGSDWRTAICHGDYHPNNLLIDGAQLTAVDTGGSSKLPIYKDMARFLVHLARRDMYLSDEIRFGVDQQGIIAFAHAFDLTDTEESMILPFMIGIETLIRVEAKSLSPARVKKALAMSEAMLDDLRQVSRL